MEKSIREAVINFIEKCNNFEKDATNADGTFKDEYQEIIIQKYREIFQELSEKITIEMLEIKVTKFNELLKKLYIIYYTLDEMVLDFFRKQIQEKPNWKTEVQIRLYMMYLKTYRETLFLLSGGFSDGAMSSTRKLYELCVYIQIINRNDEKLAERFWKHHNVQKYNLAKVGKNIKQTKIIKAQIKSLHFEDEFIMSNGWANSLFEDKKSIYFSDLINLTDYKQYEISYKMSCNFVHTGMLSSLLSLDLKKKDLGKNIWNTSPSNEGIQVVTKILKLYNSQFITDFIKEFNGNKMPLFLLIDSIEKLPI